MQPILRLGLQAMHHGAQQLDRISHNMANALTPSFKREVGASRPIGLFPALVDEAAQGMPVAVASPTSAAGAGVVLRTDTRPGSLRSTGQSLDLALAGGGYFEVMTPQGPAYTRQGSFRLDARGRLVTAQGHAVMGQGGEIFLRSPAPWIDANGQVFETEPAAAGQALPAGLDTQAQAVARIKVVAPAAQAEPRRLGDGLFAFDAGVDVQAEAGVQLRQGFLENSNVNTMQEMVQLIQTMRHAEAMQKVMLGYDDMTGQAIRRLGDFS